MNRSTRSKASRLQSQTAQTLIAAPQVVAHRLSRMATAGAVPGARDHREFHRMGVEKLAAFAESWQAMALQTLKSNQQLAASMMRGWWPMLPMGGRARPAGLSQAMAAWQHATLDILSQGIRPVQRRAVANAKRLGRHRSR